MSLEQLQQIRGRRLEKQLTEVQQRKSAVRAAEQNLAETHQQLKQFHQWRLNHQEDLFKGLQGQSCTPQMMFEYQAKLASLNQQEEQLRAAIPAAEKLVEQTIAQLAQAKQIANQLALKNEKTKEIIEIQSKAQLKQIIGQEAAGSD